MKNKMIIIAFTLFCIGQVKAQWQELRANKNIESIIADDKMLAMMSKINEKSTQPNDIAFRTLIKKIKDLKVFSTTEKAEFGKLQTAADAYISKKDLKKMSSLTGDTKNAVFFVNKSATVNQIQELVMLSETPTKKIVLIILGDFALKDLAVLTQKMSVETGINFETLGEL